MRAVPANFGSRQNDTKSEVTFNLAPQPLKRFSEELFHLAARKTDDVRVLLLAPRLVVVLFTSLVH